MMVFLFLITVKIFSPKFCRVLSNFSSISQQSDSLNVADANQQTFLPRSAPTRAADYQTKAQNQCSSIAQLAKYRKRLLHFQQPTKKWNRHFLMTVPAKPKQPATTQNCISFTNEEQIETFPREQKFSTMDPHFCFQKNTSRLPCPHEKDFELFSTYL